MGKVKVRPLLRDAVPAFPPALRSLEAEMVAHLLRFFPRDLQHLRREQLERLARLAALRVGYYGFAGDEASILQYLDLMVLLGSEFDIDDQLPWVHNTLVRVDKKRVGRLVGIRVLLNEAILYAREVRGDDGSLHQKAVLKAGRLRPGDLPGAPDGLAALLQNIYPSKIKRMRRDFRSPDDSGVVDWVQGATSRGESLGLGGASALYVVMSFLLGWDFHLNPRFEWAAEALSPKARSAMSGDMATGLHKGAMKALRQAFS